MTSRYGTEIVDAVFDEVERFATGAPQYDDITMMVIKRDDGTMQWAYDGKPLESLGDRLKLFDDYDKLVSDMSAKVLSGDQVIFMSNGSFGSARQTLTAVLQRTRQK